MKRLLAVVVVLSSLSLSAVAFADGAIICKPESTKSCEKRSYCCYKGSESDGDKYCKDLGCVRGGTSSCPTAANSSSCGTRDQK